jgi:hypothetical protein
MEKQGTKPYLPHLLWEAIDDRLHHLLSNDPGVLEDLFLAQDFSSDERQSHTQGSDESALASSQLPHVEARNHAHLIPMSRNELEMIPLQARSTTASTTTTNAPGLVSNTNHSVVSDYENEVDDYMSVDSDSGSFYDASEGIRDIF